LKGRRKILDLSHRWAYIRAAVARFLILLIHWLFLAISLARLKTGNRIAARMAMMAITTNSSIKVKPLFLPLLNISENTSSYFCFPLSFFRAFRRGRSRGESFSLLSKHLVGTTSSHLSS
jgi:hypothetical protein